MTTEAEVVGVVGSQPDHYRRVLAFAGLLSKELAPSHLEVIIVGGSAIEVLTQGGYVSGDVDLIGERKRIAETVERWGFKRTGRL